MDGEKQRKKNYLTDIIGWRLYNRNFLKIIKIFVTDLTPFILA